MVRMFQNNCHQIVISQNLSLFRAIPIVAFVAICLECGSVVRPDLKLIGAPRLRNTISPKVNPGDEAGLSGLRGAQA